MNILHTILQNKTGNFVSCKPISHDQNQILFRDTTMTISYAEDYVFITSKHFGYIKWSYFTIDDGAPKYLEESLHGKMHITMINVWKEYIPESLLSDVDFYCLDMPHEEMPWYKLIAFREEEGLGTEEQKHYFIEKVHGYWRVFMEVGSIDMWGHGPSIRDAKNALARKYLAFYQSVES